MRTVWILVLGALAVVLTVFVVTSGPGLIVAGVVPVLIAYAFVPRRFVVPLSAAAVIGLMLAFPVQYLSEYGPLSLVVLIATPVLTIVALIRGATRPRANSKTALAAAAGFVGLLTASTLGHSGVSNPSLLWATLIPALCAAVLLAASGQKEIRSVETAVVAFACVEAIYAVAEVSLKLTPLWIESAAGRESQIIPGLVRAQGTLGHPLPLALLCVVGVALLLSRRHSTPTSVTIAGALVLLGGIVATGSRSALAIVAILVAFSFGRRIWTVAIAAALIGLTALATLAAGGFFQSATWVNFVSGDSLSHRNGALEAVPRLLSDQTAGAILFGNGYFSAPSLFARGLLQQGNFYAIDNQFVTSLVETGLTGAFILVSLCATLWVTAGRYRMLVFAIVAFFFSFDLLSWPSAATIFAATVTFVACAGNRQNSSSDGVQSGTFLRRPLVSLARTPF